MPQLQLVADLPGHAEPAWCVTFNPARPLLASCSTDRTFRLYSYVLPQSPPSGSAATAPTESNPSAAWPRLTDPLPSFQLQSTVQTEHKRTVRSVAWAPSGRTLAAGSFDSAVSVWEERGGSDDEAEEEDGGAHEGVYRPPTKGGAGEEDEDEEMGEDGLIGEGHGKGARDEMEWECVTTLEGHDSECKSVGFSSDGGLLASCSRDKSVWVWEVQPDSDFECIAVMMEHSQDVKSLAWHPREEILASASYDAQIHLLFDDPDGDWCPFQKLQPRLPAAALTIPHSEVAVVQQLAPTEDEQRQDLLDVPPLEEDETVWGLAWSPDGGWLASAGDNGGIRVWRRKGHNPDSQFAEVWHTAAHSRSCFTLSWTSGGLSADEGGLGLLASAGGDGKIIVWQVSQAASPANTEAAPVPSSGTADAPPVSLKPIAAMRDAHSVADINCVAWCVRPGGKGSGLLSSCADDGSVKVWRVAQDS